MTRRGVRKAERPDAATRERMRRARQDGATLRDIAARFGVSVGFVSCVVREFCAGDPIVSGSGRRGEVVKSTPNSVTVRWDSDDEFHYTYHAYDCWICHVREDQP